MWFRPNVMAGLTCTMSGPQFGDESSECEAQSWFKVQAVPVFHFDWCKMFSRTRKMSWRTQGYAYHRFKTSDLHYKLRKMTSLPTYLVVSVLGFAYFSNSTSCALSSEKRRLVTSPDVQASNVNKKQGIATCKKWGDDSVGMPSVSKPKTWSSTKRRLTDTDGQGHAPQ
jgi:hypothetical protein